MNEKRADRRLDEGGGEGRERLAEGAAGAAAALGRVIDTFGNVVERVTDTLAEALGAILDAEVPIAMGDDIELPELEPHGGGEIMPANLRAAQAIYFAAMLEEMKLFQVVDRLLELFQEGLVPVGRGGGAGDRLQRYWQKQGERLSAGERRALYARVLGMSDEDAEDVRPNREFDQLFRRFLAAVSSYADRNGEGVPSPTGSGRVTPEELRKSARDLAANLSLHGYGAHTAAVRLSEQISEVLEILADAELRNAFGARDAWEVVDRVATQELGGAANSVRYRTMARSGAIIIRWLAEHADSLDRSSGELLDLAPPPTEPPLEPRHEPLKSPTDRDLVESVERWLAVAATDDGDQE